MHHIEQDMARRFPTISSHDIQAVCRQYNYHLFSVRTELARTETFRQYEANSASTTAVPSEPQSQEPFAAQLQEQAATMQADDSRPLSREVEADLDVIDITGMGAALGKTPC